MEIFAASHFAQLSFSGQKFSLRSGNGLSRSELVRENNQTGIARRENVDVPLYQVKHNTKGISRINYKINGEISDPKDNPIEVKHLRNLFKNLYYLDRAGIYHNDLDRGHVFFSDDGGVEVDCFRYSCNFLNAGKDFVSYDGNIRTPGKMMPSNEDGFEYGCLGGYLSEIKDFGKKRAFMDNYLGERSYYHEKREELLLQRGFSEEDDAVNYERVQAEVFLEPDDDVIDFNLDKAELNRLRREAFTFWDEGGGACGHKVDPKKRFEAILMHLDCIDFVAKLREDAQRLSESAYDYNTKEYFEYEREYADYWLNNLVNDTFGMGGWNFNDTNLGIYLGSRKEKDKFVSLYSNINPNDDKEILRKNIDSVKKYYADLAKRWDEKSNLVYKNECIG